MARPALVLRVVLDVDAGHLALVELVELSHERVVEVRAPVAHLTLAEDARRAAAAARLGLRTHRLEPRLRERRVHERGRRRDAEEARDPLDL